MDFLMPSVPKSIPKNKNCLLLTAFMLLMYFYNGTAQDNGVIISGFYSNRTYNDYQMDDVFGDFSTLGMDVKAFKDYYGSAFGFWSLRSDAPHNIGSFTQTGFYFDALANIPVNLGTSAMNIYLGGGGLYTFDAMSENVPPFTYAEGNGFGYDLMCGINVIVGKLLGGYIQYRYIDCITEGLQVGSSGLEYGLCLFLKL